jgi:excisionase family DNA binding protein
MRHLDPLNTVEEVAAFAKVSPSTVRRTIAAGKLEGLHARTQLRVTEQAVLAWLLSGQGPSGESCSVSPVRNVGKENSVSEKKARRRRVESKGYRGLPSGRYQIRVAGFPSEVVPDELTAVLRVAQLRHYLINRA